MRLKNDGTMQIKGDEGTCALADVNFTFHNSIQRFLRLRLTIRKYFFYTLICSNKKTVCMHILYFQFKIIKH